MASRPRVPRRSALEVVVDIIMAIDSGRTKPLQIRTYAGLSSKTYQEYEKLLAESGIVKRTDLEGQPGGLALTEKARALVAQVEAARGTQLGGSGRPAGKPDECFVCGRILGTGYYFICHVCGATYCYNHMPEVCKHPRMSPPEVASVVAGQQKLMSIVRVPRRLEEAFGVDGEAASLIARMISSHRREEVASS